MKKNLFLFLASATIFASCGKDDTTTTTTTPTETELAQQKARAKWRFINSQDIEYVGKSTVLDTIIDNLGTIADSIEFKSDNKAYDKIWGVMDTVNYSIYAPTKMVFDGDTFTINTLTASDFVFTYQNRTDANYYDNVVILKK